MRSALVLLSLLLLAPAVARAEDDAPSLADLLALLPPPAPEQGFVIEGEVRQGERKVGTFRLAAHARADSAETTHATPWRVEEVREWTTAQGGKARVRVEAALDRRLQPIQGAEVRLADGEETTYGFARTEDGYRVEVASAGRTPMQREAPNEGPSLYTTAALVLLGRLVAETDARSETRVWSPTWEYLEAERPFVAATLALRTDEPPQTQPVRAVELRTEALTVLVLLQPGSGDLIEVRWAEKGRPTLVLHPRAAGAEELTANVFDEPAQTPRAAALRVAMAFVLADVERFDAAIHWPTLKANSSDIVRGEVGDDAFREEIRGQFERKKQPPMPRSQAESFLLGIADRVQVEEKGEDEAVATLPKEFGRMRLTVKRVEGTWYLVRMPGK